MNGALGILGVAGIAHLVWFGLILPVLAARSARQLATISLPPRKIFLVSVIGQQLVFLAFSLLVARVMSLDLFPGEALGWRTAALAAGFLVLALALLSPEWRRQVESGDRRVYLTSPTDARERALWIGLSLAAGLAEEVTYRGVLFQVLLVLTGSPAAAVALASLAFGAGHAVQGGRGMIVTVGFAVGFHLLVIAAGSLIPAILVHAAYDIVAGLVYGRLVRRAWRAGPPAPPAVAT